MPGSAASWRSPASLCRCREAARAEGTCVETRGPPLGRGVEPKLLEAANRSPTGRAFLEALAVGLEAPPRAGFFGRLSRASMSSRRSFFAKEISSRPIRRWKSLIASCPCLAKVVSPVKLARITDSTKYSSGIFSTRATALRCVKRLRIKMRISRYFSVVMAGSRRSRRPCRPAPTALRRGCPTGAATCRPRRRMLPGRARPGPRRG